MVLRLSRCVEQKRLGEGARSCRLRLSSATKKNREGRWSGGERPRGGLYQQSMSTSRIGGVRE